MQLNRFAVSRQICRSFTNVTIPSTSNVDYGLLFHLEHQRLVELLRSFTVEDWNRPTPCPDWSIHGLVLHLIGGALSAVSWLRDGHRGLRPAVDLTEAGFVAWLDALQTDWVTAAQRISPRLTVELIEWSGDALATAIGALDPTEVSSSVSWASREPVPIWLDQARELSERWIHRQQLLEAVGRKSDLRSDIAGSVLDALAWAYPFRLSVNNEVSGSLQDTVVAIVVVGEVERWWNIVAQNDGWHLLQPDSTKVKTTNGKALSAIAPSATMRLTTEQAWRLLTNNYRVATHGSIEVGGDPAIIDTLLRTRSIIGDPK
jgi:uncharacterized protein (TIGR03083 family)